MEESSLYLFHCTIMFRMKHSIRQNKAQYMGKRKEKEGKSLQGAKKMVNDMDDSRKLLHNPDA